MPKTRSFAVTENAKTHRSAVTKKCQKLAGLWSLKITKTCRSVVKEKSKNPKVHGDRNASKVPDLP